MTHDGSAGGAAPILVPVDFSAASEAAVLHAVSLAAKLDAPLCILHVVHDPAHAPGSYQAENHDRVVRNLEDIARGMLDAFIERVRESHPEAAPLRSAESRLVVGLPVTRIMEVVEQIGAGQVVMGSSGRTGIAHLLVGSKAEQTVRLCPVPVTIVKAPDDAEEAKKT